MRKDLRLTYKGALNRSLWVIQDAMEYYYNDAKQRRESLAESLKGNNSLCGCVDEIINIDTSMRIYNMLSKVEKDMSDFLENAEKNDSQSGESDG